MSFLPRWFVIFSVALLPMDRGLGSLTDRPEYLAGMEAMELGLPEVAIRKLAALENGGDLTEEDRAILFPVLVEAQVRAGRSELALTLIGEHGDLIPPFWKGAALAGAGKFEEAVVVLKEIPEEHLFYGESVLTRASLLRVLGRPEDAAELLEKMADSAITDQSVRARVMLAQLELSRGSVFRVHEVLAPLLGLAYPERAEVDYLIALAYFKSGDFHRAHGSLLQLQQRTEALAQPMAFAVPIALADSEVEMGKPAVAVSRLLELIDSSADSPFLHIAFDRLSAIEAFKEGELTDKLNGWAEGQSPGLAALANFYLGAQLIEEGSELAGLLALNKFRRSYPRHFLVRRSLVESARLHVKRGEKDEALAVLEDVEKTFEPGRELVSDVVFLRGLAQFSGGEFLGAAANFEQAALGGGGDGDVLHAIYNAAVASIKAGDPKGFERLFTALGADGGGGGGVGGPQAQADLLIGAGLELASAGKDAEAIEKLEEFVKDYAGHPRMPEARLALAELYLLQYPRREKSAFRHLSETAGIPEDSEWREQLDYVRMWAEEGAAEPEKLIEEAQKFMERWPKSERIPEVRMKLGERYFRLQDFPNAQTQFELLATDYPDSPYAEAALFFAGRSAMSLMNRQGLERAIEIWGQVVDRGGELGMEAKKQQAIAKRRLGQDAESIMVLDAILSGEPAPEGDFFYDVLCEKGETLFTRGGENDTTESASIFRKIAEDREADRVWRIRARFHLAKCLEKLGDKEGALEACFEAIAEEDGRGPEGEEFVWFYRAGFEAVHLLQEEGRWVPALNIAEKLAGENGPRSQEAKELAEEIRLKHFLWDERKGSSS